MIHTFLSREAEDLFHRHPASGPWRHQRALQRKLAILDAAVDLTDLRSVPNNRVETISGGSHKGLHRLLIAGDLYLCFRWMDGDAYRIDLAGHLGLEP